MSSIKSSRKRTAKASSDNAAISFDLLSSLTYMAALADGNPSRDILLRLTISQNYQTGIYFRQVYLLAKRMGFEYTRAFRMVARKAGASIVRNHLLRFAGAITAGVSEKEFLAQEARVEREQYINNYYRSLEALAKWGDAYAALLVSVSLVVVVAMISTMLSDLGSMFVLSLTGATFFVRLCTGLAVATGGRSLTAGGRRRIARLRPGRRRSATRVTHHMHVGHTFQANDLDIGMGVVFFGFGAKLRAGTVVRTLGHLL